MPIEAASPLGEAARGLRFNFSICSCAWDSTRHVRWVPTGGLPCVSCQKRRLTELAAPSDWRNDAIGRHKTLHPDWWLRMWVPIAPAFRPSLTSHALNVSDSNPAPAGAGVCIDCKSGRRFNSMQIGEIIQCRIVRCPQRGWAQASSWLNLIVPSARWGCGRSKQCQSSFPTI